MATTRIMALKTGKGRSVARALKDTVDYMENPHKTDNGEWISSYECDPATADSEFLLAKQKYTALTGRSQGNRDVIAYHVRQSFKPGEITPAEANRIGYELAMRFTKGRYAFIVCTHTDKEHIHSHIVWNSTALDHTRKFRNFFFSAIALRRCSDILCAENGLSVIEKPGLSPGNDYGRYMYNNNRPPSFQQRLRNSIDAALEQKPATFEDFLGLLRGMGVTVMDGGKKLKFFAAPAEGLPDHAKKPTRCDTLKGDYTVAAIMERIAGERVIASVPFDVMYDGSSGRAGSDEHAPSMAVALSPAGKSFAPDLHADRRPGLLIDIQAKLQAGKGAGYERFAKLHNLKQMAATLIYLQEQGIDDYGVLQDKASAASARFNELSDRIKTLDDGLADNAALQKQIVLYTKTRKTYVAYRKAGYSAKFKAANEADIILHQAAKKYFDELGYGRDNRLPTVAALRADYATMLAEKKQCYKDYRQAKDEMKELLTARANVDRLFNANENQERERRRQQEEPER